MKLGLEGRTALVLGASRGLGRQTAAALAAEGVTVAVCARDVQRTQAVADAIGGLALPANLTANGEGERVVRAAEAAFGRLDILVVNTGGPPAGRFVDLSDGNWRDAFEGLWMSSVGAVRAALVGMQARGHGRVLFITSVAAREPVPNLMLSNALRAGLHGMVNALSREVAPDGVCVNALMPGFTMTERLAALGLDERALCAQIPAGRIGTAEDFGAVATFLCSAPAGYITGQALAVDGGLMQSI